MKCCIIACILGAVYFISNEFDYPATDDPWFYGIASLWSILIILFVAVFELAWPTSSIYSSCLSVYIMCLESVAVFINFLAVLGGLQPPAYFYLHWDYIMNTITVLELLGLFLFMLGMLGCGITRYRMAGYYRVNI